MKKVAIVGVEGSGKTVMLAGLGELYSQPDENGHFLSPKNFATASYVADKIARMRGGEWPTATAEDVLQGLDWTLKHKSPKGERPEGLCEISCLDFAGEVYRNAFGINAESGTIASNEATALKNYIRAADAVIVLINLRDIIVKGVRDPRVQEAIWITRSILQYAIDDAPKGREPCAAIVLTQADSYAGTIESCGGVWGVLKTYLRDVANNYDWLAAFAVSSVDRTRLDDNGNVIPDEDFTLNGLKPIVDWILKNAKPAEKSHQKQRKDIVFTTPDADDVEEENVVRQPPPPPAKRSRRRNILGNVKLWIFLVLYFGITYWLWGIDYAELVIAGGIFICGVDNMFLGNDRRSFKVVHVLYWLLGALLLAGFLSCGSGKAQKIIADRYYEGDIVSRDYEKAVKWYRRGAKQGCAAAQNNLGDRYYYGQGVQQDYTEAVKWYRKAANQGDADAQNNLGFCYQKGLGVSKDYNEAVKWYRKAVEQGNAVARNNLGVCYYAGKGVAKDYAEAVKWYRKAAEQGNADAQNNLGFCYQKGLGVSNDYNEAAKWYRKAAEQGNADAQKNLGFCYEKGLGVSKDYNEAVKWYRKAVEQGNAVAQNNLGVCYYAGKGVAQDYAEAVKWYRKAAEQGNAYAQNNLGECCRDGEGVKKDLKKAEELFRKAAEQGNERAKKNLDAMKAK